MIRICILLLSAVLAATAVGQTVTGRVVDDESGEALPSASVYAKSLAKGTSTDSDGRFEMAIPEGKTVDLRISYVGYKETTIQIKREVRLLRCACSEARSCVMCRSMVRAMTLALNPRR